MSGISAAVSDASLIKDDAVKSGAGWRATWTDDCTLGSGFHREISTTAPSAVVFKPMGQEPKLVCEKIAGTFKMVQSSSEFSELFTAGGGLNMEGWGASGSVTMSATQNMKLSTNSLTAVSSMRYISEPIIALNPSNLDQALTLSPDAKELLETEGPDKFHAIHGSHYIAGYTKGGYLLGSYHMEYSSQEKATSVSASIQAKFESAVGLSGGASANFESSLSASEKATKTTAQYFCRGWSNKAPPKLICKLEDLEAAHNMFDPEEGVKLAAVLRSYRDIPSYASSRRKYFKSVNKQDDYEESFMNPDNYGIIISTLNREYGRLAYLNQLLKDSANAPLKAIGTKAGNAMKKFQKLLTTANGTSVGEIRTTLKNLETFIVTCQGDEDNVTPGNRDRFNVGRDWINANFAANSLEAQLKALAPAIKIQPPTRDTLLPGQALEASTNDALVSKSGAYRLVQQSDGNLVLYNRDRPLWSNGKVGQPIARTVLQGDGNVVSYTGDGRPLWATGTDTRAPNANLLMQDDGNLVLYSTTTRAVWSTGTNGK